MCPVKETAVAVLYVLWPQSSPLRPVWFAGEFKLTHILSCITVTELSGELHYMCVTWLKNGLWCTAKIWKLLPWCGQTGKSSMRLCNENIFGEFAEMKENQNICIATFMLHRLSAANKVQRYHHQR